MDSGGCGCSLPSATPPKRMNPTPQRFTADPGAYFTIQSSLDLVTWTDAGNVLAETVTNSVVVTSAVTNNKLFWRMRRGQ